MVTSTEKSDPSNRRLGADLQVCLLGPPRIEWADSSILLPRRQARALLYCLAARLRPFSREQLCFLFWPDTPESAARRNLSRLLSHLRNALPAPEVLPVRHDLVGLDASRVWSDTVAFEDLYTPAESQPRTERLQQAVDLYGGVFLSGFSLPNSPEFELWVVQERYTWEQLYFEALQSLIETRTAQGYYSGNLSKSIRDERVANKSNMNGVDHVQAVFTDGRDVAANGAEGLGTGACAKSARYFLLDLYHPDVAFSQVVVKGNARVVHKSQDLRLALLETVEQVLGW